MKKNNVVRLGILCLILLIMPIISTSAKERTDNIPGRWGLVIEAHCDARYWIKNDGSGVYGCPTMKYFVLGIGYHTIDITTTLNIQLLNGTWTNHTDTFHDYISLIPIKPIAKHAQDWPIKNFKCGFWQVNLLVDETVGDSEWLAVNCTGPFH